MTLNYITIGKLIRQHRINNNITQEELAFRIGSSAAYISYLENGKKKPSLHKLLQISEALNVTVNDFIYGPIYHSAPNGYDELSILFSQYPSEKRQILLGNISMLLQTLIT